MKVTVLAEGSYFQSSSFEATRISIDMSKVGVALFNYPGFPFLLIYCILELLLNWLRYMDCGDVKVLVILLGERSEFTNYPSIFVNG